MAVVRTTDTIYEDSVDPTASEDFAAGYQVGDDWRNTSSGKVFHCQGDGSWINMTDALAAAGFGGDYAEVAASGPESTTSDDPQDFLTLATGTRSGDYLITWEAIFDNGGDLGEVRLFNDTDTVILSGPHVFKATDSDERALISGVAQITLAGVTKDLIIQYNDQDGGSTHTIRDAQILIWKVS